MTQSGRWILEHGDLNDNGVVGFGLADAWDAFGDGTVNPAHQEYAITTSLVIEGLMDWLDADPQAPRDEIHRMILACLAPYLSGETFSPSGLYAYSLHPNDKKYDMFNPAVHLAGQMQRYSQMAATSELAAQLAAQADGRMQVVLQHRRKRKNDAWYWHYGLGDKLSRTNDLAHAMYIVDGIRSYCEHGGRYAADLNLARVVRHVDDFYSKGKWCEWPGGRRLQPARLWGLGMVLYLLPLRPHANTMAESLVDQLAGYYAEESGFRYLPSKYRGVFVRHDAHLMLGLSYWLFTLRGNGS